jgi:hypothetical protein
MVALLDKCEEQKKTLKNTLLNTDKTKGQKPRRGQSMFSMSFLLGYAEELAKEKRKDKFEILLAEIRKMAAEEEKEFDEMCDSLASA